MAGECRSKSRKLLAMEPFVTPHGCNGEHRHSNLD
jgi:hypothetical protein